MLRSADTWWTRENAVNIVWAVHSATRKLCELGPKLLLVEKRTLVKAETPEGVTQKNRVLITIFDSFFLLTKKRNIS